MRRSATPRIFATTAATCLAVVAMRSNAKGVVIAQNVDDLHSANNKLSRDTALTERGTIVAGVGYTPVWHDALTGSDRDGRAFPGNMNMTCNNWSRSEFGKAILGHIDRTGLADNEFARTWDC